MPTPLEVLGGCFAWGIAFSLLISLLARAKGPRGEWRTFALSLTFLLPLALSSLRRLGPSGAEPWVLLRHAVPLLFAPGLYLWLSARTGALPRGRQWLHLLPFAIGALAVPWAAASIRERLPLLLIGSTLGGLLSALGYYRASRRLLEGWKARLEAQSSFADRSTSLAYVGELFAGLVGLQAYLFAAGIAADSGWRSPWLNPVLVLQVAPASFALYFSSRAAQRDQHGMSDPSAPAAAGASAGAVAEVPTAQAPSAEAAAYAKSGLDEARLAHFRTKLEAWMEEEEAFRDFDLSLADVTRGTGIARHAVSQTLNAALGLSFYEWVNTQRAAWVRQALDAGDERSLAELSLQAGFRSRSSFGTHFRKLTGSAPTDYRRKVLLVLADRAGRS